MTIKFYKTNEEFGFLNNFTISSMYIYNRWWNTVEAAYQSKKTLILSEQESIWLAKTPREARNLGQKVHLRSDWDNIKDNVMYECVLAKFLQNYDLKSKLVATSDHELIEDSPVDFYWGIGHDGTGHNMLGKTLMKVRSIMREEYKSRSYPLPLY